MKLATTALLLGLICSAYGRIRVKKTWRAAASQDTKAVMAARANGAIEKCEWINGRDSYTSEDSTRGITVSIEDRDTLCKLTIDRADSRDHSGKWDVIVYGECDEVEFRRTKRQAEEGVNFPGQAGSGVVVSNLKPGASDTNRVKNTRDTDRQGSTSTDYGGSRFSKLRSDCDNKDEVFGIQLEVAETDELIALAGQDKVYGLTDKELTLTARTNGRPSNCIVQFNRRRVIELRNGRDDCNRDYKGTQICVENYESRPDGIYACNVKIDRLNRDLEGDWEITVEREDRRSTLSETVTVEVFQTAKPEKVTMRHDGREVTSIDRIEPRNGEDIVIQCEVEGGGREVDLELLVGNQIPRDLDINNCRALSRDAKCVEFKFRPSSDFRDEEIFCQAVIPGVDLTDEQDARASAKLEISSTATSAPKLLNGRSGKLTVCTNGKRERDEFEFEVVFESNPRPTRDVEWEMKSQGRTSVQVREGDSESGYESFEIESVRGKSNQYIASMLIERLAREDTERGNIHELRVNNGVGREVTFEITLDESRDCKSSAASSYRCNVRGDSNCRCNRRGDECCDITSRCREGTCCQQCQDRRNCFLCDNEDEDCMELKTTSGGSGGSNSNAGTCRRGDRDCVCVEDDDRVEHCCVEGSRDCPTCRRRDPDTNCFCDRNDRNKCVTISKSSSTCDDNGVAARARQIMLESCLKMSSTLLEFYKPDGSKRTDATKSSDRDVERDLNDYFRTASCTGFETDIRDYAKNPNRNRDTSRPLTALSSKDMPDDPQIAFLSNQNGPNKVEKVAEQVGSPLEDEQVLENVEDILAQQAEIEGEATS